MAMDDLDDETLSMFSQPGDAQAALIAALRQQQAARGRLEAQLDQQHGQAGGLRSLAMLTSLGSNPLLAGVSRTASQQAESLNSLSGRTEARLGLVSGQGIAALRRLGGGVAGKPTLSSDPASPASGHARDVYQATYPGTYSSEQLTPFSEADIAKLSKTAADREKEGGVQGRFDAGAAARAERERLHAQGAAARAAAKEQAKAEQGGFKLEGSLRKEFMGLPAYKNYQVGSVAFDQVLRAASNPSPAGDIAVITNYMRSLDPSTGVKDQEFNNAQNAGGFDTRARAGWERIMSGQRLTPEQRKDFVQAARANVAAMKVPYDQALKHYSTLAESYKIDPARVALPSGLDLEDTPLPSAPPPAAPIAAPKAPPTSSIKEKRTLGDGTEIIIYSDGRVVKRVPKGAK